MCLRSKLENRDEIEDLAEVPHRSRELWQPLARTRK
jgi:hypothetical protein